MSAPLESATLLAWAAKWAAEKPNAPALLTEAGTIDFAALHARARGLAAMLRKLGIGRGDVIAAQLPNSVEIVLTYLATGYAGATLQTIHMPYRAAELEVLLKHGGAKAFICLARTKDFSALDCALGLRPSLPRLEHLIAIGSDLPPGVQAFPDGKSAETIEPPAASDRFLLLYTSGTTSAPKGVPVSYDKFLPNAARSAVELGVGPDSILLSAAPYTHLYGIFSLNMALSVGAATALMPAFTPAALAAALDLLRPTALFAAPAHVAACLNEGLLTQARFDSLRFVLISGSACPVELARTLQTRMRSGKVLQLWGMSELQAGSFTRPDDDEDVRFGTAGRASPGTELRVAVDGRPVAPDEEAELQVRGPSLFEGYLDNAQATAGAFEGGWFRTGDLARMDARGNVRITGRSKDVINRGGVKFNPSDVEELIGAHPAVASCAIVPAPDPVLGERACCFVVLEPGAALRLEELCAWLAARNVAKLKWPERLELIDAMPMTPTRKIMKGELAGRLKG